MVKHKIVEQLNFPPDSQAVLSFRGTELEDERTISEYEIYDKTPINMMLKVSSPKIIVKTLAGKVFILQVKRSDSIRAVKQKIEVQEGILFEEQRLIFAGNELEESKTITDYEIFDESTLYLLICSRPEIFVKTITGKTLTFRVKLSDSIQAVKLKIEDQEGIFLEKQCLLFAGKLLENKKLLSDYKIRHRSVLYLVLRLIGIFERQFPNIIVKAQNGDSFIFERFVTIKTIKTQLEEVKGFVSDNQFLFMYYDKPLDNRMLWNYMRNSSETVYLVLRVIVHIVVERTDTGRTFTLEAELFDTIEKVKRKIEEKERVNANQQQLSFDGEQLDNIRTLSDYNMKRHSTVYVKLCLFLHKYNHAIS